MNQYLNNLRFIFYTNEKNLHLIELSLKYFFKYNTNSNVKVSVVSNKIIDFETLPFKDKVSYINADINFNSGGFHFSDTMKYALKEIKEEYIFFFCDDYFFTDYTKFDDLEKLLGMIINENIDYFGFDTVAGQEVYNWVPFKSTYSNFPEDYFYLRNNDYRYVYSVQPSIWKKTSLQKIVNSNDFSLHNLDETRKDLVQENYKCIAKCNKAISTVNDFWPYSGDYFVINYLESVRHGVFLHSINLSTSDSNYPVVRFNDKLIEEENLLQNLEFDKLLYKISPRWNNKN